MKNQQQPRRNFIKKTFLGTIAVGAGMSILTPSMQSFATLGDDSEVVPNAKNEKEFRMGVIGPAELSLATSRIAQEKASQKNAKEFAGFELTEAIAVTGVLKDLGTPVPPMDAKAKATLEKIKNTPSGNEFDKTYIKAQLENHEFLRDLAQNYLNNSKDKTTAAESQGRHLATLALATFKEHVAITQRILGELNT
jgi:predicted outer membrane protein